MGVNDQKYEDYLLENILNFKMYQESKLRKIFGLFIKIY